MEHIFSEWEDSPLGCLGLVQGFYEFPKEDSRYAEVASLVALVKGLEVSPLDAAHLIYKKMHQDVLDIPSLDDLPYLG